MRYFDKKSIDLIQSQSVQAEQTGQIPADWLNIIYKKNYFRIFVPKQIGGSMMPLPDALRLFDEAGSIDGNLGWALAIGTGGAYFYAYMQPATANKVFNKAESVIAGSGAPTGVAKAVKGGYIVNGSWKYASGANYATSFTANVVINERTKAYKAFTFEPPQIKVVKNWDAFGLKATEGHTMIIEDAFVPEAMTFDLGIKEPLYKHAIYQFPFLQFAELNFGALSLGLCRHFFAEAHAMLKANKKTWSRTEGRMAFVTKLITEKEKAFNTASDKFYKIVESSWKEVVKTGKLNAKAQAEVSKVSKKTSRVVLDCMDSVIPYLGMGAMMEGATINQIWRDTHTTCQHILLVPFAKV